MPACVHVKFNHANKTIQKKNCQFVSINNVHILCLLADVMPSVIDMWLGLW